MILAYDGFTKQKEKFKTGLLMLKYMEFNFVKRFFLLVKLKDLLGAVNSNEYYISNIAVFPEYRKMGIGKRLLVKVEEEAKKRDKGAIVLDVEVENSNAIRLYKKLGYSIIKKISVKICDKVFNFYKMQKLLN